MEISTIVLNVCVVAFTALAAYIDWRWGKIPNWLTVTCFATALVFHFTVGLLGWNGTDGGLWAALTSLIWAVLGFATGFGILLVLYLTGGSLGGDVKLMGAIGAWLMPRATLYVFILASLLVCVMMFGAVVRKLMKGKGREAISKPRSKSKQSPAAPATNPWQRAIPFGVPVAIATWGVLAFQWMAGK